MTALAWSLGGSRLAYSTVAAGDMHDPPARSRWLASLGLSDCARHKQVHGSHVRLVDVPGYHGEGDALITRCDDVPLLAYGADCPGLAIVTPDCRGLAHCGWRGCAAGLPQKLIAHMRGISAAPIERWQAFVGPGICADCYEVDQPVIAGHAWPPGSLRAGRDAGHAQLDLQACILSVLADAGLEQIASAALCTAMDERLWSFRHQGRGMVQALILY